MFGKLHPDELSKEFRHISGARDNCFALFCKKKIFLFFCSKKLELVNTSLDGAYVPCCN